MELVPVEVEGFETTNYEQNIIAEDGVIVSCEGLVVGDKISHPKNGLGEITGFVYWKRGSFGDYNPKVKFEESNKSSSYSTKVCLNNRIGE